jgi:hypothetical protein
MRVPHRDGQNWHPDRDGDQQFNYGHSTLVTPALKLANAMQDRDEGSEQDAHDPKRRQSRRH